MRRLSLLLGLWPSLALAQTVADKRAALDKLLDALRTAPTEQRAAALEERISQSWVEAGSPAVTLLMARGLRSLRANAPDEAFSAFNDAILLDPTLAEAWHQRAIARLEMADAPGAAADLRETLRLEPRHFGAWRTLEQMSVRSADWKKAYEAFQHVLEIDPRTPNGEEHLKTARKKAFGDDS